MSSTPVRRRATTGGRVERFSLTLLPLYAVHYASTSFPGRASLIARVRNIIVDERARHPAHMQTGPFPAFTERYLSQRMREKLPEELLDWLAASCEAYLKQIAPHCAFAIGVQNLKPIWANVHERGEFHAPHNHALGECVLAGVLFLSAQDPNAGKLVLESSLMPSVGGKFDAVYRPDNRITISPAAGTLVLFPPMVRHYVTPHLARRPRYSVAFNVAG